MVQYFPLEADRQILPRASTFSALAATHKFRFRRLSPHCHIASQPLSKGSASDFQPKWISSHMCLSRCGDAPQDNAHNRISSSESEVCDFGDVPKKIRTSTWKTLPPCHRIVVAGSSCSAQGVIDFDKSCPLNHSVAVQAAGHTCGEINATWWSALIFPQQSERETRELGHHVSGFCSAFMVPYMAMMWSVFGEWQFQLSRVTRLFAVSSLAKVVTTRHHQFLRR